MARLARVVIPDCWHHVTQRGNQHQTVFFDDQQRQFYLRLLRSHCRRFRVGIGGFCLMGNHVHILAIPSTEDGLSRALGRTHNDYARWMHLRQGEVGHLWQNRFYSCPLDNAGRWEALRYVELNPVRAGLATHAADWPWSSARAHLQDADAAGILALDEWRDSWTGESWQTALEVGMKNAALFDRIRRATHTGRPFGSDTFVHDAELRLGRRLSPAKRGPKIQAANA